ncbi:MAG TPA: poly-beta-1,6-N-acetyl-D-glucosamine N-deacetylase PgaB [Gammaproteobacteria bacterium]|jgi:biofilm PGA synthesis lipoprotein PgaB
MARLIVIPLLWLLATAPAFAGQNTFLVLAYHDVRDDVVGDYDPDQYAVSTANLIEHFTWLRLNGFNVVSIDDILAAREGGEPLPDRAILLTFDDGYKSVATHVLPLLELFDYPAVVSVVTDWIESDSHVSQAGYALTRDDFLTWDELHELANHELIEIGSHSHNLHRGVTGNPQGNEQPAAVTMRYGDGEYETPAAYAERLRADLENSVATIESETGVRPRVMTWPFGAHSEIGIEIATELGMPVTLTLTGGVNSVDDLSALSRHLIHANPEVGDLAWFVLRPETSPAVRAAHVDLDYVYSQDPAQQEANLGQLLDRIKALEITHVFLQAFADPDADGGAQALYFPNRYLPMRADLFNRVAWQLQTRAGVIVYAWLPILSYEGAGIDPSWRVRQLKHGELSLDPASEPRLSPFSDDARAVISGIYADLARHAQFQGILFHDDGRFNEFEDASAPALAAYREHFGPDFSFEQLAEDPALTADWARFRSDSIIDFTAELTATVRRFRPHVKTARNLFATALLAPHPELRLGQNFDAFTEAYDHVAVMAMPRFENFPNHRAFYEQLAAEALGASRNSDKVIFELQTVDWRTRDRIDATEIRDTMRHLQTLGVRNLAYYPDDFITGHPDLQSLREGMSVAVFPMGAAQ